MESFSELGSVSLDDILHKCDITHVQYIEALTDTAKDTTVFLRRKPSDVYVNNYNRNVLSVWKANMDLQFVISPYAAIHYITNYITKDEREMGLVLQAVSKEVHEQSVRSQMKKCADAFANSRTVSAQEAIYRVLGLPLHSSSFRDQWIPTGYPHQRIRILKPQNHLDSLEDDDEDVFATGLIQRYASRPDVLNASCLAEFAMWFDVSTCRNSNDKPDFTGEDFQDTKDEDQLVLKGNLGKMRRRKSPKIIRYHQCSLTKDPELYYYNKLLLFHPWRDEEDLKREFTTYSEYYHSIKEQLDQQETILFQNAEEVEIALQQYTEHGPPSHLWDEISPQTEQMNADEVEEGVTEDPDHSILSPIEQRHSSTDTPSSSIQSQLAVELIPQTLPDPEYRTLIQTLNTEQRQVFQHLLNWCQEKTLKSQTSPEYIFVSGGAGTGKSHLIKAVCSMAVKTLRAPGDDPSKIRVLLTAPTGTAAFNIGAVTLHSAFLLPLGQTKSYKKLSDDKRNTLRTKLSNLSLLIIDEISMVGSDFFQYVDRRLQEINLVSKPFGGISVVAFGDMYQLPPVAQRFVFQLPSDEYSRLCGSVWQDHFKHFELKTIMRQKDDKPFAELLNRVRTASHTAADILMLQKQTLTQEHPEYRTESLHIFARNKGVDAHNAFMLQQTGKPLLTLQAKEKRPQCLINYDIPDDPRFTGGVSKAVTLCKNARVMLIRNIDVCDGLVNGAQGIVKGFNGDDNHRTTVVFVQFDKPATGFAAIASSKFDLSPYPHGTVPITPIDVKFSISRTKQGLDIILTQFPLKLAWGSSIHKVQGLTLENVVVSFDSPFCPGQAYVALSRAKSLQGLQLLNFNQSKITANKHVQDEMLRLNKFMACQNPFLFLDQWIHASHLTLGLLNASSMRLHFKDIQHDPAISKTAVFCVTETHVTSVMQSNCHLPGYDAMIKPQNPYLNHHGLAIYSKKELYAEETDCHLSVQFELITVTLTPDNLSPFLIFLLYRSPSSSQKHFLADLSKLLYFQQNIHQQVLILGDFNIDANNPRDYQELQKLMLSAGFTQIVQQSTHKSGSSLDLIFISSPTTASSVTMPVYYSDHFLVLATI